MVDSESISDSISPQRPLMPEHHHAKLAFLQIAAACYESESKFHMLISVSDM